MDMDNAYIDIEWYSYIDVVIIGQVFFEFCYVHSFSRSSCPIFRRAGVEVQLAFVQGGSELAVPLYCFWPDGSHEIDQS